MTEEEAMRIFQRSGSLLNGHFILRSGQHSRQFFQCATALQQMPVVEQLGGALAEKFRNFGATALVSPAMGGLVIGQEIARQLRLRFIFAEKENGALKFRRGFRLAKREKVIIAEDVITQGGRVQETIKIIEPSGAAIVGIAVLVDRSDGSLQFPCPLKSLIKLHIETFDPDNLPADLQHIPAVKPGS